jgi:integrase
MAPQIETLMVGFAVLTPAEGGKRHEMPAHHKLEAYLDEYIRAAGIADDEKSPLFRSARGRTGELNGEVMHRLDAWRMIQRRAGELGLKVKIGCHTFRATGIMAYLEAGGTLENAQLIRGKATTDCDERSRHIK